MIVAPATARPNPFPAPAPWADPLSAERLPERLRADAIEHGRALALRHGDDLLGAPLGYADVVAAIGNRRLQLLSDARAGRLSAAQSRFAAAVDAGDAAATQLKAAVEAARELGIDHPSMPTLGHRIAAIVVLQLVALASCGAIVGTCVWWVASAVPPAVICGLATSLAIGHRLRVPLVLIVTSLAIARVGRATDRDLAASAAVAAAEADRDAVRARSAALAKAEIGLADELLALHLKAATTAMPNGSLSGGARLDAGHLELAMPDWMLNDTP